MKLQYVDIRKKNDRIIIVSHHLGPLTLRRPQVISGEILQNVDWFARIIYDSKAGPEGKTGSTVAVLQEINSIFCEH